MKGLAEYDQRDKDNVRAQQQRQNDSKLQPISRLHGGELTLYSREVRGYVRPNKLRWMNPDNGSTLSGFGLL